MSFDDLMLFTLYRNPSDFPDRYVIRRTRVTAKGPEVDEKLLIVTRELSSALTALESVYPGLVRMERNVNDDPCIVCVYL